jgi:hypothetical protein
MVCLNLFAELTTKNFIFREAQQNIADVPGELISSHSEIPIKSNHQIQRALQLNMVGVLSSETSANFGVTYPKTVMYIHNSIYYIFPVQ